MNGEKCLSVVECDRGDGLLLTKSIFLLKRECKYLIRIAFEGFNKVVSLLFYLQKNLWV